MSDHPSNTHGGRLRAGAAAAVFFLPIAFAIVLAVRYFCPLPIADYWDVLTFAATYADGGLGSLAAYLWQPFVDQRMVFPKIWIHSLAQLTGNRHYGLEIALGFAAQLVVLAAFLALLRPRRAAARPTRALLWLAPVLLLFWPALHLRFQHHWYSTQYSLVLAPAMLALIALARRPGSWRGLGLAMLGAAVSGLSHGTGALFSVAVAAALLVFPGWSRAQRVVWWCWTAFLVVMVWVGMPGGEIPGVSTMTAALAQPFAVLRYAVGCLGVPPRPYLTGALLLGLLGVVLVILTRAGRLREPRLLPLAVVVFWVLGTAAITAAYRSPSSGNPPAQYHLFSVLLPIAVIGLLAHATEYRNVRLARGLASKRVVVPLLLVAIAVYAAGARSGVRKMRRLHRKVAEAATRIAASPVVTMDDVRPLFPFDRIVTIHIPFLKKRGFLAGPTVQEFTGDVIPTRYRMTERVGLKVVPGGAAGVPLEATASNPHLTLVMEPPLARDSVLAIRIRVADAGRTFLQWQDADGWHGPAENRFRGRRVDGRYWFGFPERPRGDRTQPITAIRIVFPASRPHSMLAIFENLEARRRAE